MKRRNDPVAWPPPIRIDREVAGWCTGLFVLLLVGFPLMICAMFAQWEFQGYLFFEEGNSRPNPVGGLFWLGVGALLLTLPVAAGLLAGRTYARVGRRLLIATAPFHAAVLGVYLFG